MRGDEALNPNDAGSLKYELLVATIDGPKLSGDDKGEIMLLPKAILWHRNSIAKWVPCHIMEAFR